MEMCLLLLLSSSGDDLHCIRLLFTVVITLLIPFALGQLKIGTWCSSVCSTVRMPSSPAPHLVLHC